MPGFGGGGQQTTTTNNTPPAEVMEAYRDIMGRARRAADTPYEAYSGELVAPNNENQRRVLGEINWLGENGLAPYLASASDYIGQGAAPITGALGAATTANMNPYAASAAASGPQFEAFSPLAIQKYLSPYTANVVDATSRQFAHDNAVQQNEMDAFAAKNGVLFGGDRAGLAKAELAAGQRRAQDPITAQLYDKGYSQALGQYNEMQRQAFSGQSLGAQGYAQAQQLALSSLASDAARAGSAGSQMSSLGNLALTGGLTGLQAAYGAASVGQDTHQKVLDSQYQQWLAQKGYDFQTTQFLANTLLGTGAAMGGTSTTTGPAKDSTGSWLGAGLSAISLIPKLARGGAVSNGGIGGLPYMGASWVPTGAVGAGAGRGLPQASPLPKDQGNDLDPVLKGLGALKKSNDEERKTLLNGWIDDPGTGFGRVQPNVDALGQWIDPDTIAGAGAALGGLPAIYRRGGAVPRYANGGATSAFDDPQMGSLMRGVAVAADAFRSMRRKGHADEVIDTAQDAQGIYVPQGYASGGLTFDDRFDAVYDDPSMPVYSPSEFNEIDALADAVPLPRPRPEGFGVVARNPAFRPDISSEKWLSYEVSEPDGRVVAGGAFPERPDMPQLLPNPVAPPTAIARKDDGPLPPFMRRQEPDLPVSATAYDRPTASIRPAPMSSATSIGEVDRPAESRGGLGALFAGGPFSGEEGAFDKWLNSPRGALFMAGIGMMGSNRRDTAGQIADGALTGLSSYQAARKLATDAERIRATLQRQDAQQQESARHNQATEIYRNRSLDESIAARRDIATQRSADRADTAAARAYPGEGIGPDGGTVPGLYQYNPETREYDFKPGKTITSRSGGAGHSTALQKNIDFYVKQGIARNPSEAAAMLRAGVNDAGQWIRQVEAAKKALRANPDMIGKSEQEVEKAAQDLIIQRAQARPAAAPSAPSAPQAPTAPGAGADQPPIPGARRAPDGKWYKDDPARPGKYLLVQ